MGRPLGGLVAAALLWGAAVTGTKYALAGFGPVTLLAVELIAAAAVLWAVLLARGGRPVLAFRPWWLPLLLGLLEPGLAYLSETLGLSMTSAVHGAVLSGLEAALVVVLARVLLGERAGPAAAGAVLIAMAGLVVLATAGGTGGQGSAAGDLLVATGVLCASVYTITAKRFADGSAVLTLTAWQFTAAAVASLPAVAVRWASGAESRPAGVPARFWLAAVLVGVAGYGVSFLLFNRVLADVDAGWAAVVLNLIPVFGLVTAVVFLGERMTRGEAAGAGLVGLSVLYFTLAERREAGQPEPAGLARG
jgi:drug/metabolite transporter (DMT)-like permease